MFVLEVLAQPKTRVETSTCLSDKKALETSPQKKEVSPQSRLIGRSAVVGINSARIFLSL
jgi:hypothetical protein